MRIAYPLAVLTFVVGWVFVRRIPRVHKAVLGAGTLVLAGYYIFSIAADHVGLPNSEGLPAELFGSAMLLGGLVYVVAVASGGTSSLGPTLEVAGLALLLMVFAVPSSFVLLLPIFTFFLAVTLHEIRNVRRGKVSAGV